MREIHAKSKSLSLAEAFLQSEASVRLEGIDPLSHPRYVALKERVLAGQICPEEAVALLQVEARKSQTAAA